ncbi:hypothetical protein UFOVP259_49 [uncultured Caudovirales phage]|uniref:Uncharacterized protein n=1 Tax=uncultured Caudovirales phage TaxID=2100421 RepID=A0A6J5LHB3_9CAUD|nr:hypothetical protein UFOVP259_49 [uncultured Caudovirales phage]
MKVADAVEVLANTYQSLDAVAQGLEVKASEVATALAKAKPDTVEFVCLTVLSRYNPVQTEVAPTESTE